MLSGSCLYYLLRDKEKGWNQSWLYIGYTAVMFVLGTLHTVCLTRATQFEYVDDRNFPGGPLGFAENADLNPAFHAGVTVYIDFSFYQVVKAGRVADGQSHGEGWSLESTGNN